MAVQRSPERSLARNLPKSPSPKSTKVPPKTADRKSPPSESLKKPSPTESSRGTTSKQRSPPADSKRLSSVSSYNSFNHSRRDVTKPKSDNKAKAHAGTAGSKKTTPSVSRSSSDSSSKSSSASRSSTARRPMVRTNSNLKKQNKENRNTVPPFQQKSIKVAPESLAQRAKTSSEERLSKFRRNMTRAPSVESKRKGSTASESDRESPRSQKTSRSSSICSETSQKSISKARKSPQKSVKPADPKLRPSKSPSPVKTIVKQTTSKVVKNTESMRVLNSTPASSSSFMPKSRFDFNPFKSEPKSPKTEPKTSKPVPVSPKIEPKQTKEEPKSPETKVKKLFPINPIQNLIKFYESPDKNQEKPVVMEEAEAEDSSKFPVVLEDKYSRVLFPHRRGSSPSPSRISHSPSVDSSSPQSSDTTRQYSLFFLVVNFVLSFISLI